MKRFSHKKRPGRRRGAPRPTKRVLALAAMIVMALVLAGRFHNSTRLAGSKFYRVVYVYDGDTIRLSNGTRVRLIGLDCPETHDNDKLMYDARRLRQSIDSIKKQGREAFQFTRDLALGKNVFLEYDIEKRDKYGRLLAYVWVQADPEEPAGDDLVVENRTVAPDEAAPFIFVNASLLKAGYARPMTIAPNDRYRDEFERLYNEARENKRGLWGGDDIF